jgi:hypothetical protein
VPWVAYVRWGGGAAYEAEARIDPDVAAAAGQFGALRARTP